MGHWTTGVAVITARTAAGRPCGLTANAVCSLSLDPTLVLACIERVSDTHSCIRAVGAFAINILGAEHERMARRFSGQEVPTKFEGVAYREERTGAPVLEEALAWVDCRLWRSDDGGDHAIFIGEVLAGDAREGAPLLFYRGGYGGIAP
jgi:flavin reductase (DIM6/NTAB) family NADH-FMN oxidoreductase RutF